MRRADREITQRGDIDAIIRACRVCRLGLCRDDQPYVVPLCFGYDGEALYFHSASEGEKLDILRSNNRVCVEFDIAGEFRRASPVCQCTIAYRSVIAFGIAEIVTDSEERRRGLSLLASHYGSGATSLSEHELQRTCVIRVRIDRITGKQR